MQVMNPLVLLATGGDLAQDQSMFYPTSPGAESIRNLSVLVLAITGFIFIVVEGILIYAILRFRRRDGSGAEPPQVYGSKPIEIAWTAAPALIVFVLMMVTTRTVWEVVPTPPPPRPDDRTLFVTVIGHQWWWEYRYDHYDGKELGFVAANELHIPAGANGVSRPVYLCLQSADVCHSFWVPRLAGKTDLIPGRTNQMWFQTDQTGTYRGNCAEYCGTQHANMLIRVVVDSPGDFERWLDLQEKDRWPNRDDPRIRDEGVVAGEKAFLSQSCVNCHAVRGTPAKGRYAPDLTHLMSRRTLASGMIANDPEDRPLDSLEGSKLRAWVADPQKIKPGCLMPAFGLSDRERNDIVRYLLTLR
jgi:cytochrome c oxidase subunit II